MRKIIQICTPDNTSMVALCDDGSVWYLGAGLHAKWSRVMDIPQDDASPKRELHTDIFNPVGRDWEP